MSGRIDPRLGPEHVGQRVVVRRRIGNGRVADVLGELLSWDQAGDGTARVRSRHGEVVVPLSDVVAGKPVPPAPVRRGAPHAAIGWQGLQDVVADGWRPLEMEWLGAPGQGWRLRAAEGFTGRANSVLAVGDPGMPLGRALQVAEGWYAERGLAARFSLAWPLNDRDSTLDVLLAERGYVVDTPTLVMSGAARQVLASLKHPGGGGFESGASTVLPSGLELTSADEPDDGWLSVYHYRGQELPAVAARLLMSAPAQVFVAVRSGEHVVAVGRGASSRGWTGVTAMEVVPAHRRRGLATVMLGELAAWAVERGDRSMYLQVAEHNSGARGLYAGLGFADHHGYHYRVAP
ncbi:GNAT family N-acetyltransferase [Angustibacter sp. McL0619]|uniref:GNAT family N-acetyltransferase n=1 Tax=Angustibacter sp. McL0619 TaxID=3415676 RepID=UPI003CF6EC14